MHITIPDELKDHICNRARSEGLSVEGYAERLIREDQGWAELTECPKTGEQTEFAEIRAAVEEGLEQAERGEVRSATDVFADLLARHDLPR